MWNMWNIILKAEHLCFIWKLKLRNTLSKFYNKIQQFCYIWIANSMDHVTCLHFAWPLEYQGDFLSGKNVCICMQSLYILYNKICDTMLLKINQIN